MANKVLICGIDTSKLPRASNEQLMGLMREIKNGNENATRASNAIDNTQALSENIKRLEEQKKNLVEIRSCVEPFQVSWSEITKTE